MSQLDEYGYREELSRALSLKDMVVYGMIFMVPIAPYSVFGFVWADAKGWCRSPTWSVSWGWCSRH
jgi:hypothetical protein